MSFTAGDLRIVRELTHLLTKIQAAGEQLTDLPPNGERAWTDLTYLCRMETTIIVKVFPSLKKPIAEFNEPKEEDDLLSGYEDYRRGEFKCYLEEALNSLDEEIVEY